MSGTDRITANTEIIRSKRKTLAMQISDDGRLVVRVPLRCPNKEIVTFIEKNEKWIMSQLEKVEHQNAEIAELEAFSKQDIEKMAKQAMETIPGRVKLYADKVGVTYGRITIRNQKTKWGSCTSKGNLNFNCLLMAAPPEVLDSVIVHELCHRLHMDHSKAFYEEIYRVFPEYDKWNKWLKDNGRVLIRRMLLGTE